MIIRYLLFFLFLSHHFLITPMLKVKELAPALVEQFKIHGHNLRILNALKAINELKVKAFTLVQSESLEEVSSRDLLYQMLTTLISRYKIQVSQLEEEKLLYDRNKENHKTLGSLWEILEQLEGDDLAAQVYQSNPDFAEIKANFDSIYTDLNRLEAYEERLNKEEANFIKLKTETLKTFNLLAQNYQEFMNQEKSSRSISRLFNYLRTLPTGQYQFPTKRSEDVHKEIETLQKKIGPFSQDPLLPDDNDPQGSWIEEDPSPENLEAMPEAASSNSTFRKSFTYTPAGCTDSTLSPELYWVITHGTWGYHSPYFFDNNNPLFRNFKRAAAWDALCHKKRLKLLSLRWETSKEAKGFLDALGFDWAHNSNKSRLEGGDFLAHFVTSVKTRLPKAEFTWAGHSHGTNLHNSASNLIEEKNAVQRMIHFAPPNRESQLLNETIGGKPYQGFLYKPHRFKELFYFHSTGDFVVPAAQLTSQNLESLLWAAGCGMGYVLLRRFLIFKGLNANVFTEIDSAVAGKAVEITQKNIIIPMQRKPFELQDQKVIVGIETQIDNKGPGHSALMQSTLGLTEILKKLYGQYPYSITRSGSFLLDVNTQVTLPLHVILAAEKLPENSVPPVISKLAQPLYPLNENSLNNLDNVLVAKQIFDKKQEEEYAKKEKHRYLIRYGKPMVAH